jgi:uncharacterized protein (DUF305 family)
MSTLRTVRAAVAVVVGLLVASACGSSTVASRATPAPGRSSGSTAELEALYRARADSALMRFNEADVRFMTGMIGHHTQALVMSGLAPSHDASATVRTLTARTINAQQDEIATMRAWLADRGQPVPEVLVSGTTVMLHDSQGNMDFMEGMPGMLSDDQMRELDAARGSEFDRLFLTFMIQHHAGAVAMVHELFATDGAAQGDITFKIASDIQVDQASEIDRMERMLDDLPGADRRP